MIIENQLNRKERRELNRERNILDFKCKIVYSLKNDYGLDYEKAKELVFEKYEQLIGQDIVWSQNMGYDYWSEMISKMK